MGPGVEAGIRPKDLDAAFAIVCEHEDVEFDEGSGRPPAFEPLLKQVEKFRNQLGKLLPDGFSPETKCKAQLKWPEFEGRLAAVRRQRRLASLAALLTFWNNTEVTRIWWSGRVGRDKSFGERAKEARGAGVWAGSRQKRRAT